MGTFEYVENQSNAISEISRILRKEGVLIMTSLNYVAEGDVLRKFARTEHEWDNIFNQMNFAPNKVLAKRVISRYVRKIILFDNNKIFNNPERKGVKLKVARILYATPVKYLILIYQYYKQLKSGYLMLSYKKA